MTHGNVPHDRNRLYIVGLRRDHTCKRWAWPEPVACPPLCNFLDPSRGRVKRDISSLTTTQLTNLSSGLEKIKKRVPDADLDHEPWVLDLSKSEKFGGARLL